MAIKKYTASIDTTITDAFKADLQNRGVDANMGASDTLEVFSIYAQGNPELDDNGDFARDDDGNIINSVEKARILLKFPIDDISEHRDDGEIPAKDSVEFYLKLYNATHAFTLPTSFNLTISPITTAWTEGIGLDMEEYLDRGASGSGRGADWESASSSDVWTAEGGDFSSDAPYEKTVFFQDGNEDLDVDVTDVVEAWIAGDIDNHGVIIRLESSVEDGGTRESYYTKRFFARGTEYFFKKPTITAQWNSAEKDDRGKFYRTSNLRDSDAGDNDNVLYLKNRVDGVLTDIPTVTVDGGGNDLTIKIYETDAKEEEITPEGLTVEKPEDGTYTASVEVDTELDEIYVEWQDAGGEIYHTETIDVLTRSVSSEDLPIYVTNITNMKSVYSKDETARFKLYTRLKDWNPTIYTVASTDIESNIIETAYYRLVRVIDEEIVMDYGDHTMLSYDESGNYFDLDMDLLEPNFAYRIELQYEISGKNRQQPETFKFRVE